MILTGVDPGLFGALAFLDTKTDTIEILDMPVLRLGKNGKNRGEVDAHALAQIFWQRHAGHVFIEQSWSRPENGSVAAHASGRGIGRIEGVLAAVGVPMTFVAPQAWKRALGVPAEKDGARARASQLLPTSSGYWPLKKHDGRAEAALICLYGFRSFDAIGKAA